MQQQNTPVFINKNKKPFAVIFFKWRAAVAIGFALSLMIIQSCNKLPGGSDYTNTLLQQYFENNILNRDFIVSLATDNGADLTSQYNGYIFRLTKNTLIDGPITGTKNGTTTYTGTWSCNEDYSKLVINITQPTPPAEFIFLNRQWRFTKKDIPTMELAPWGSSEPKVLHMLRQ
ncbi:MAG: hypothetical protein ABJA37_13005 [Ferruginibacter sp.]